MTDIDKDDLKQLALLLLVACESTDGVDHVSMFADISDGEPYYSVTAWDGEGIAYTFSAFPDSKSELEESLHE